MDQTTVTLLTALLSVVGGLLVGRSTIRKQNAEAVNQATNAGYVSVQTFALLRKQVEEMQTTLMTAQDELLDVKTENEKLKKEILDLKSNNDNKDLRIAELERKLKNFIDPKTSPRRRRRMP